MLLLFISVSKNNAVIVIYNDEKNILLEKQKTLIEDKQTEILSSIRYAKRIQDSLLPSKKYISKNINKQNGAK